jgi:retinol dehydrogenase-12
MTNKLSVVITGGTSGFGKKAVIDLLKDGHDVWILYRDESKRVNLMKDFIEYPGRAIFIYCNLSDFKSVSNACDKIIRQTNHLDILINNAGIWNSKKVITVDGIEETFQVNVLSPLLISEKCKSLLKNAKGSKIINTASGLHQGGLYLDNINWDKKYSGFKAYRHSKLALILMTRAMALHYFKDHISVYSFDPGMVKSQLQHSVSPFFNFLLGLLGQNSHKGAKTLNYIIQTPQPYIETGSYFKKRKKAKTTTELSLNLIKAEKVYQFCYSIIEKFLVSSLEKSKNTTSSLKNILA